MFSFLALFGGSAGLAFLLISSTGTVLEPQPKARLMVILALTFVFATSLCCKLRARSQSRPAPSDVSFERILQKTIALTVGWALIVAIGALGSSLQIAASTIFFDDILPLLPILPIAVVLYVLLSERLTGRTEDACASFGAMLLRKGAWIKEQHKVFVMGWLVKAFFLPLMYGNLVLATNELLVLGTPDATSWIPILVASGLCIDLLVATVGYLSAGTLFGGEIKSVDDSWLGWAACLICYAPFFQHVKAFTEQRDSLIWSDWLQPHDALYWIWGALLLGAWSVYWLSAIAFGLRFSNLTYRGLVDRGPYKYLKHPAYLSKNIYWWLYTVPFVGVYSLQDFAANFAGLAAVSLIYYLRAKTEERHLSRFPEYVEYSRRIEERSLRLKIRRWSARALRA